MLPTDRWLRALLVPALVFAAAGIGRNYQTDLWHHLARGRVIAAEGRLLDEDRFSCTVAGQPFQDANWAWQVLHYELFRQGGLPLLQAFNAAVLAAAMAVLGALCARRSGSLSASAAVGILVFLGLWQLVLIRPQTFSLLYFVLLYACLEGSLSRPWLLVFPPVILAAWANTHGGFPVGLALVGCYALGTGLAGLSAGEGDMGPRLAAGLRASGPWAVCLLASLAATCVNPYGWRVWQYVALTAGTAAGRRIDEWLPPGVSGLAGKVFVGSVLLLVGLYAWTGSRPGADRRRFWLDLSLVACFLPAACGSVRMLAWWLPVIAPILAERLADAVPRLRRLDAAPAPPSAGAALCVAALALLVVLSLPWLERFNPVFRIPGRGHRTETDLQAVADHLRAGAPEGKVFTRFDWGEYLGWSLEGRYAVFMDGRIEIFPDEVWAEYSALTRGRADWEELLRHYGVDCVLLDASGYHRELLPLVEKSPHWHETFRQGDLVLFEKRAAAPTSPAGEK
jgi:hypothetical protein